MSLKYQLYQPPRARKKVHNACRERNISLFVEEYSHSSPYEEKKTIHTIVHKVQLHYPAVNKKKKTMKKNMIFIYTIKVTERGFFLRKINQTNKCKLFRFATIMEKPLSPCRH